MKLVKALAENGCVSCSMARRAIFQGAVSIDDERIEDIDADVKEGQTVRLGKIKEFVLRPTGGM